MEKRNRVFIATSIDGYVADRNGKLDWLHAIPNLDNINMGHAAFMSQINALIMGRITFETICSFDMDWPYEKPVFVLSNTLTEIPMELREKVFLVRGVLTEVLAEIHNKGYYRLYMDGGATIQGFLRDDLIDEMIITTIPVLLGGGSSLFGKLTNKLHFECIATTLFLEKIVQNHFRRIRLTSTKKSTLQLLESAFFLRVLF